MIDVSMLQAFKLQCCRFSHCQKVIIHMLKVLYIKIPKNTPNAIFYIEIPENTPNAIFYIEIPENTPNAICYIEISENTPNAMNINHLY